MEGDCAAGEGPARSLSRSAHSPPTRPMERSRGGPARARLAAGLRPVSPWRPGRSDSRRGAAPPGGAQEAPGRALPVPRPYPPTRGLKTHPGASSWQQSAILGRLVASRACAKWFRLPEGSGIEDRRSEIGDRGSEIGDRGSEIGDRGSEIGDRRSARQRRRQLSSPFPRRRARPRPRARRHTKVWDLPVSSLSRNGSHKLWCHSSNTQN